MQRKIQYPIIALVLILVGCNTEKTRKFEWDEETAQLTGKDLRVWLRRAPFTNELSQSGENQVVFTNASQVFPFMARYKNAIEELWHTSNNPDNPIYQEETVLFQDQEWGDLFVSGTLLYEEQEVFLDRSYSEAGNPAFDGLNAGATTYSATLYETSVFAQTADYKTGIYWATASGTDYLLGFYQKNRLVFSTAIPLRTEDTLATLSKLKEVSNSLNLQIPEWNNASVQDLWLKDTYNSFWKDPFTGIYLDNKYLMPSVYIKVKDTPLQPVRIPEEGDYYYDYDGPTGAVILYTVLKETGEDRQTFIKANEKLQTYKITWESVFYEETPAEGRVIGLAKVLVKDGEYLEVHFAYPEGDESARKMIHGILKTIKIPGRL